MQAKTLFSQHYLEHRLLQHPEWDEDPGLAFEAIRSLWQKAVQYGDAWNEAQTEDEFIKPVLEVLAWSFIVQATSKRAGQLTRPDYAFFADDASRDAAYPHQGEDSAFYGHCLAVGEAKYWGRPLSQREGKAESNPSHQMVSYLVGTRVPWGILTNGRLWRLYSREVSSTASEFYQVDLATIFGSSPASLPGLRREPDAGTLDAFKHFWLFFRRDAFLPDAEGNPFVQRVHEGSATYARQVSDKLKELVFERIMPEIAGGFVAYRAQELGVQEETEESLRQVYQASLGLLYKFLFLLYAEARALLPVSDVGYRQQSLTTMAQWAATQLDKGLPLSDATYATSRYDGLLALFHRIDQGDASLDIPRYNGGLFNPAHPDNQFLEDHRLSDRAVAVAVDSLVRDAGQPVDYAYISVRNLGAIYEGLLENKLRVVDAAAGQVELVNDKGERKATGSYYTPDYIVSYIVQHTLEPTLTQRDTDFRAAMERCAQLRRQLRRSSASGTIGVLRDQMDEAEGDARDAFLGIKVLDPAMGSGHFLVNAVDFLTDGIIQRMQAFHDQHPDIPWEWNPIERLMQKVREEILAEMARQGVAVDPARLDDTALLTRLVMKRCIYGVDLNPMAVELAKMSLWLHSFTVGAPLSFLDHHLRWGNSLIGTDVRTVEREIQMTDQGEGVQLGLFQGPFAGLLELTGLMTEIAERADATLADVRHSADTFDQFQKALTPYKQVLDLWVSQYFDNETAREFLMLYGEDVLPALRGEKPVTEPFRAAIERARALWPAKRFFHWDLEFPEVFVDLRRRDWAQNPGFDVVIGNPPYVRSIRLRDADADSWAYYPQRFRSAAEREYDVYLCFVEQGLGLLNLTGHFGMILPNKWFTTRVGESLRSLISRRRALEHVVDFRHFQAFEGVTTYTCMLFLSGSPCSEAAVAVLKRTDGDGHPLPTGNGDWVIGSVRSDSLDAGVWTFPMGPAGALLGKLAEFPTLASIAAVFMGTGTRADDVFLMRREGNKYYSRSLGEWVEIESGIMRPSLTGRDIDAYYYDDSNWLLFPYAPDLGFGLLASGEIAEQFPRAWAYLNDPANEDTLRARDGGRYLERDDWYCHVYPRNLELLGKPKLVLPDVAGKAEFAWDFEGRHIIDTAYGIHMRSDTGYDLRALAAVLNSQVLTFFLRQTGTELRGGYFRMKTAYLNPFPVPLIRFTTAPEQRRRWAEEGQHLCNQFRTRRDYPTLRRFVACHLEAGRSDVVHDMLAYLAEGMIAMHKEKQAHLRAFRLDLAGYLDQRQLRKLNRLYTPKKPPKADAKNYEKRLANYQQAVALAGAQLGPLAEQTLALDDFWQLNQAQWMWLLRQNLGSVDTMSQLVAVYQGYHSQLAPLMGRIERTDWLIDQIVYQLYGLTEDEIAVVEGGSL